MTWCYRYRLSNWREKVFAEFPLTPNGLKEAKKFRSKDPRFKGQRVVEVVQLYPLSTPMSKVVELDYSKDSWGMHIAVGRGVAFRVGS